ncbi:MAG: DUF4271 domain-containing protein [Bacteroidaceae bacterium]|nr:DUF4271 domain-containing protein [Bacteroidaceae bacterium]
MNDTPSAFPIPYSELCARDSLLACDSLLFNEEICAKGNSYGIEAHERAITSKGSDVVTCFILLCFILLVFVVRYANNNIKDNLKDFFFPTRSKPKAPANATIDSVIAHIASVFIISATISICYLIVTHIADTFLSFSKIHIIIAASLSVLIIFIYFRMIVCRWVHWVFFSKDQRVEWNKHFYLLLIMESLLLFPFSLLILYGSLPIQEVALSTIIVLILLKIIFIFKVKTIFFPRFYGSLYLFIYLCALEGLPLLLLWSTLDLVSYGLISKI